MSVVLTVDLADGPVRRVLQGIVARSEDLTPVMKEIGAQIVTNTQMRFEKGAGPGGVPWKRSIRALTQGGQTLVDSGRLRASITFRAGRAGADIGTNVRYAAAQQFGATIRPKTRKALRFRIGAQWATKRQVVLPPRPFLGFDREDFDDVLAIARDHLRRIADGPAA